MKLIRNKYINSLNIRGRFILLVCCLNVAISAFNAYNGSWSCIINLAIAFLLWVVLQDPRNFKYE